MMFGTDEKNVSDVTIERFKHEIGKRYQGTGKHHNPLVLYSGLKPLKHERALPTDSSYTDISDKIRTHHDGNPIGSHTCGTGINCLC